jgi:hypothetical protein
LLELLGNMVEGVAVNGKVHKEMRQDPRKAIQSMTITNFPGSTDSFRLLPSNERVGHCLDFVIL